jgi:dipeptidyl aminopeptidase/acylaminoacyl peptidase
MTVLSVEEAAQLGDALERAWGSWSPTMTRDADRVAFVSDRGGSPQLWVQDLVTAGPPPTPVLVTLSDDPVLAVRWSADDAWLACSVATDGGVRTQVWVVRPDGSDARQVAGDRRQHAELGPWTRSGHGLVVTYPSSGTEPARSFLVDPVDGSHTRLAEGDLIHVLDLSVGERLVVVEDGPRGHQFCVLVDRESGTHSSLLPHSDTGSTEVALLRPAPLGDPGLVVAYLATDVGLPTRQLVSVQVGPAAWRNGPAVLARRDDAELEALDSDDAGRLLLLVWNVAGRSEIELLDTVTEARTVVPDLPGPVVSSPVLSRDGAGVVLAVEGPTRPRELWHLETVGQVWTRVTDVPELPARPLVVPTPQTFTGRDGLRLSGWLYRAPGHPDSPGPAVVHLHGGPEAQERPAFSPQHQAVAAAGISVLAPNIRGSCGFGRAFVHADDLHGRAAAFDDVRRAAELLVDLGVAEPGRIAVTGRSYGGYLTLVMLAFSPGVFAAGVDICGMSDLRTFYRDTEPWIAAAAVTKYGHPERDRDLLVEISPLRSIERIEVPLLVVHGEHDTNVPIGEAHQVVEALTRLDRPVHYLELPGEGHELRRADSRARVIAAIVAFLGDTLSGDRR